MAGPGRYSGCSLASYKGLKSIGKGAYAEVKEGIHKDTKEKVALKIYDKNTLFDPMRKNNVLREIKILEGLDHPNIMKILDCIDNPKQVIIVLEFVKGISLKEYLANIPTHCLDEQKAILIFKQIVSAISYCHEKGITHRDLKLENILLMQNDIIKIIDFGFSISARMKLKTFCGTPTYMAPEIINKGEYEGPPTDMWALGIIFFALLCGVFPFQGSANKELYKRISKGIFSIPNHVSANLQEILNGLLCVDPIKRMTASQVLSQLSEKFLSPSYDTDLKKVVSLPA